MSFSSFFYAELKDREVRQVSICLNPLPHCIKKKLSMIFSLTFGLDLSVPLVRLSESRRTRERKRILEIVDRVFIVKMRFVFED